MGAFIIRRLLQAIPVLFLISLLSFWLMEQAPGGPSAQFAANARITPEQVDAWLKRWCLERNPDAFGILREYGGWLGVWNCETGSLLSEQGLPNFLPTALGGGDNGVLHGDFGYSIKQGRPVSDLIVERVPATLVLMLTAFVIWVSIAIVLGVVAAVKRYSLFDQGVTLFSYIFYSLPTFWLGLILIYFFAVQLRWLPPQGIVDPREAPAAFNTPQYWTGLLGRSDPNIIDIGRHLVLPVVTLVAVSIAGGQPLRALLDARHAEPGLRPHGARQGPAPQARHLPPRLPQRACCRSSRTSPSRSPSCSAGAIVTETIFSWPGMGRLYFEGVSERDYFLLMGILLVGSVLVVLMNLVADVLYAFADPRIRY